LCAFKIHWYTYAFLLLGKPRGLCVTIRFYSYNTQNPQLL
jgi:hypothetical protein